MAYDDQDLRANDALEPASEWEEGVRTQSRPVSRGSSRAKRAKTDPSTPSIDRPAHPLPQVRSSQLNYDQYLLRSTDKFQIFSASERRARNKRMAAAVAGVVVLALIIIWVAISRMA